MAQEAIDFVLPWVDGDNPKWLADMKKWKPLSSGIISSDEEANSEIRYRSDNDLLRYWFRAVEKFAPWVNKVFFVTCGQKPEWLNENHPKLVLINHEDYIPSEYLPTFNSDTIELNLHRIPALSDKFVLFNDDFFLLRPVSPEYFFKESLPVLPCDMKIYRYYGYNQWSRVCMNDYGVVASHFNMKKSIWENRKKWLSITKLGFRQAMANVVRYKVNKTFFVSGFEHIAYPHLKSTFQEVWSECFDVMDTVSKERFRSDNNVNHWMLSAWNLLKGNFSPVRSGKRGIEFNINTKQIDVICNIIKQQSVYQLCINDTSDNDNPEYCNNEIKKAFVAILAEKSSFEK